MAQIQKDTHNPMTFARLMRLGQVAHAQGDNRTAHEYWQQAAMLEPDNEQVWTALMWVLDDDEDRKVCLKNILAINPKNIQAKRLLDDLIGDTQPQIQDNNIVANVDPNAKQGIDFIRVIILSAILGIGISMILILLQMLLA